MKRMNRKRTTTGRAHSASQPKRRNRKLRVVAPHTPATEPVADHVPFRLAEAWYDVRTWLTRKWLALRSLP